MNITNDKSIKSWIPVPEDSDFPLQNLPFGIISRAFCPPRAATRIGDTIIDLSVLAREGYLKNLYYETLESFDHKTLNRFIAQGKEVWSSLRRRLFDIFSSDNPELRDNPVDRSKILFSTEQVEMLMPLRVGDYTDFYSSREHATNVGIIFRDPKNPLLPNWLHLPVAYHGRSSSIFLSGTKIHRPKGQILPPRTETPIVSPAKALDFELEMAFAVGKDNRPGESVGTDKAEDHIFGFVLFNDLTARDIQRWEYVPLGPFLSKNFGSVISPWIVSLEALEPFRVSGPPQTPPVLPYLEFSGERSFDINLEVWLQPEYKDATCICRSNFKYMYWNISQQLAHHTVNGCNIQVGDLCASGTISGPETGSYGSLLELSWNGQKPIILPDGEERKFLEDYDTVIMKAYAEKDGLRIGFGESRTTILPAN